MLARVLPIFKSSQFALLECTKILINGSGDGGGYWSKKYSINYNYMRLTCMKEELKQKSYNVQ